MSLMTVTTNKLVTETTQVEREEKNGAIRPRESLPTVDLSQHGKILGRFPLATSSSTTPSEGSKDLHEQILGPDWDKRIEVSE